MRCTARLEFDARQVAKMPYTQHLFAISVSDLRTLFCRKKYLCTFLSQKEFAHTFYVVNTVYVFFFDFRILSGKFLRVESCHPGSSDFLGLWVKVMMLNPSRNSDAWFRQDFEVEV